MKNLSDYDRTACMCLYVSSMSFMYHTFTDIVVAEIIGVIAGVIALIALAFSMSTKGKP